MRGKRRRFWEGCKTLLIVLLTGSAVYLAGLTLFPQQTGWFLSRLPQSTRTPSSTVSTAFSSQTLRPAALAVTWQDGRYGLLYHQDDQEAYTQISALLAEALSDAAGPVAVTGQVWEQALSAPGLYCEYLGSIPLDVLTRWLSGQDNPALSGIQAQALCVTGPALYVRSGQGGYYSCALDPDLSQALADMASHFSSNGAHFAGEDSHYAALRPDSLILPITPRMPQLLVEDPITIADPTTPGQSLSQLLQALSFHPQTNPIYSIPGGWAITDSGETLRISVQGQVTYRRSDMDAPRFLVGDSLYDATRSLAEATVGTLGGNARLYLQQVFQDGNATVVTYGYAYLGTAIQLGEDGWCAQFTVNNGAVESFVLKPRHYTVQEETSTLLLPQEQAAAALPALRSQTLELLYADDGQAHALTPFWAVRQEGR